MVGGESVETGCAASACVAAACLVLGSGSAGKKGGGCTGASFARAACASDFLVSGVVQPAITSTHKPIKTHAHTASLIV
jgi:hypothetical protein